MHGRHLLLMALAVLLSGCMPTDQDIGRMVLISAPVWFAMGWMALGCLLVLWRRALRPVGTVVRVAWRPSLVMAIVLITGAVAGGSGMTREGWEYFLGEREGDYWFTALMVGFGYVTVALVVWRVWFSYERSASFTWALPTLLALFWLPALPLVLGSNSTTSDLWMLYAYAALPGGYGILTGIVLAWLVIEALRHPSRGTEKPPNEARAP